MVRFQFAETPDALPLEAFAGKGTEVRALLADDKPLALAPNGDVLMGEIGTSVAVAGASLDYGVVDRGGAFMLVYHAKAAATPGASQGSLGLPMEMFAEARTDGTLSIRVLCDGRPAAGADIVAYVPGTREEFKGKADGEGRCALPKVLGLGTIGVRAGVTEAAKGAFEGKAYASLHRYTTLTLASAGAAAPKADPAAYALLERATSARASLPVDLASVSGTLTVRTPEGKTLRAPFETGDPLSIETDGWPRTETLAVAELVSGLFERRGGDFARGDGRNPVSFDEDRRVLLHDQADTSYVVKGDEIAETARTVGKTRVVTKALESVRTPEGKVLPRRVEIRTYDLKGFLLKAAVFVDEYALVDGAWLPKLRKVITTAKGKTVTRETRFEALKLKRREAL